VRPTGNDPELDSDREPEPPTKTIDKPAARHGKRDAPKEAASAPPTAPRGGARGGRGRGNGNDDGELNSPMGMAMT
jgi:plasminogen activator inhibitor 1 RNA-binding protein